MKRLTATLLALVTGLSLLFVAAPAQANAGVAITLTTDKTSYNVNDPVTLTVTAGSVTDLYGATIDVYYDSSLLQVDSGNTTAASVITNGLAASQAYNRVVTDPAAPNRVSLIALRLGNQPGYTGTGTLGTIKFTALAPGSFTFTAKGAGITPTLGDVVVQLADSTGADITVLPGSTAAITIAGTGTTGTLAGRITLSGRVANFGGATVELWKGNTLVKSGTADANGDYTIGNVPVGTYTVYIRRGSFLTLKVDSVVIADSQTTQGDWTLNPGNISDSAGVDDRVFLEDLLALAKAWGTADPAADLDGDGAVGPSDLNLLNAHWGETGADSAPSVPN